MGGPVILWLIFKFFC